MHLIVHQAFRAGHGSFLFKEKWELKVDVGFPGAEALEEFCWNGGHAANVQSGAMRVKHLNEAAHMRALVLVGQVDGHRYGRYCLLDGVCLVSDGYGVT